MEMQNYMSQFRLDDLENLFFDDNEEKSDNHVYVLIIYDIVNNSVRTKFSKFLLGYGFRVQKSAFEARLTHKKYDKLVSEIPGYITEDDSVRMYKIIGKGQVLTWGEDFPIEQEEIILI